MKLQVMLAGLGFVLSLALAIKPSLPSTPTRLPHSTPESAGMDSARLAQIDRVVAEGIAGHKMPGCVVAIGRRGKLVFLQAYGNRQVQPTVVPMTTDTIFDLASVTKPVATATSIMQLIERGQLRLHARV